MSGCGMALWRARGLLPHAPCPGSRGRPGRFRAGCRYAVAMERATARARISQFADANRTCRWLRFFAIPR